VILILYLQAVENVATLSMAIKKVPGILASSMIDKKECEATVTNKVGNAVPPLVKCNSMFVDDVDARFWLAGILQGAQSSTLDLANVTANLADRKE
jgi:hypothetical protein